MKRLVLVKVVNLFVIMVVIEGFLFYDYDFILLVVLGLSFGLG